MYLLLSTCLRLPFTGAAAAAGSGERAMPALLAASPAACSAERSSLPYASESRHKFGLLAKRVLIVLLYSVLLVVCLLLVVLYFVFIWPAKRLAFCGCYRNSWLLSICRWRRSSVAVIYRAVRESLCAFVFCYLCRAVVVLALAKLFSSCDTILPTATQTF